MVSVVDVLKNVKVDRVGSREIKIIAISIVQDQEEDSQKLVDIEEPTVLAGLKVEEKRRRNQKSRPDF